MPRTRQALVALLVSICFVVVVKGQHPPTFANDVPANLQALLSQIRAGDTGQLAVSEEDGRFLRVLVAASRARNVLEIGGAQGYSAIWIGLGLRQTGGRLTTIEYDPGRAKQAAENVRKA